MAAPRDCDPTLMGIPKELRMKIFEKLFEDEYLREQYDGHPESIYQWPHQILQTCKTLHDEAEEAMTAKVSVSNLEYFDLCPPYFKPEDEAGPKDAAWGLSRGHVRFLRKYGKLIRRVSGNNDSTTWFPWCSNIEWFPNLESFTISGFIDLKLSKEDVNYCGGKMSKARFFEAFEEWYKDKDKCELDKQQLKEIAGRKGVDRKYGVHIELCLEVTDVEDDYFLLIDVDEKEIWEDWGSGDPKPCTAFV